MNIYRTEHTSFLKLSFLCFLLLALSPLSLLGQTKVQGKVVDVHSNEALTGACIYLTQHCNIGAIANHKGLFNLSIPSNLAAEDPSITISMVGYQEQRRRLSELKKDKFYWHCSLVGTELETVLVRPKKVRYRKKGNPAVAIIEKAIARKENNRIEGYDNISYQVYKRQTIGFTDSIHKPFHNLFGIPSERWQLWSDTSAFEYLKVQPFSLHERQSVRAKIKGKVIPELVIGRRYAGLEESLEGVQMTERLEQMIPEVNMYDNNFSFLYNSFPSPMSRLFSTSFYKYYLLDTIPINGRPNYQIGVLPFSMKSIGFKGTIWVDTASYALTKLDLAIPKKANVNWIKDCYLTAEFAPVAFPSDTLWLPKRQELHILMTPTELIDQSTEFNQVFVYHHFRYGTEAADSLALDPRRALPSIMQEQINHPKKSNFGMMERPEDLSPLATRTFEMMDYIHHNPNYFWIAKSTQVLARGFIGIPWGELKREDYYAEIGPIESTFAWNTVEGFRMRLGGMTSARLNRHLFARGYLAYGFGDKMWKYYANLIYTPLRKEQHENEFPRCNFSLSYYKDLFVAGYQDEPFYKDGIGKLLGTMKIDKRYYEEGGRASFLADLSNEWQVELWGSLRQQIAAGTLSYYKVNEQGVAEPTNFLRNASFGTSITYTPNRKPIDNRRPPKEVNKDRRHPTFNLSASWNPKGLLGNPNHKAFITAQFNNRFYLSLFGYLDADVKAGIALGKVNETDFFTPEINASWVFSPARFQLLEPLEFVADKYLECSLDYHLRGLILNRIPWLNSLGLREVLSFHCYWGDVSKNRRTHFVGEYVYPNSVSAMNNQFYCEGSVGLENILNVLSVYYCYRFTPNPNSTAPRWKIKMGLNMSF